MSKEVRIRLTFYRTEDPALVDELLGCEGKDGARLLKQLIRDAWTRRLTVAVNGSQEQPCPTASEDRAKAGLTSKTKPATPAAPQSVMERLGLDASMIVFEK